MERRGRRPPKEEKFRRRKDFHLKCQHAVDALHLKILEEGGVGEDYIQSFFDDVSEYRAFNHELRSIVPEYNRYTKTDAIEWLHYQQDFEHGHEMERKAMRRSLWSLWISFIAAAAALASAAFAACSHFKG